jgi:outer membrane protein TolC
MIVFACFVMTAALLYFIFNLPAAVEHPLEKTRLAFLRERKESVYENLRDLKFEYKAGKMPEADYVSLRASLEDEAAAVLAEIEQLEAQRPALST